MGKKNNPQTVTNSKNKLTPKMTEGIFTAVVQFDNHTCRCMHQFPDCIYPKLWISPNKITKKDIQNFIKETDERMLVIYREFTTQLYGHALTDTELCKLGNQGLHINLHQNPEIIKVAFSKPNKKHINKQLLKHIKNNEQ